MGSTSVAAARGEPRIEPEGSAWGEAPPGPSCARWDDHADRRGWVRRPRWPHAARRAPSSRLSEPVAEAPGHADDAVGPWPPDWTHVSIAALYPPSPTRSFPGLTIRNDGPGWAFEVRLDIVGRGAERAQPTAKDAPGPHIGEGLSFPAGESPATFVEELFPLQSMRPNETVNCELSHTDDDLLIRVVWTDARGEHAEDHVVLRPGRKARD